jgi:hypothetical protein
MEERRPRGGEEHLLRGSELGGALPEVFVHKADGTRPHLRGRPLDNGLDLLWRQEGLHSEDERSHGNSDQLDLSSRHPQGEREGCTWRSGVWMTLSKPRSTPG